MAKKEIIKKPLIKKKKKWYKIFASKEFNRQEIGQSPVSDTNLLIKKQISTNLVALTNDPKKQNIKVVFSVDKVEEDGAYTDLVKYELISAYVKRIVKRDKTKIEDSFIAITKDEKKVRIKPIVITKNKTKGQIASRLRNELRQYLLKHINTLSMEELFQSCINHTLQNSIRENIKKIYPINSSEIRILEKL